MSKGQKSGQNKPCHFMAGQWHRNTCTLLSDIQNNDFKLLCLLQGRNARKLAIFQHRDGIVKSVYAYVLKPPSRI